MGHSHCGRDLVEETRKHESIGWFSTCAQVPTQGTLTHAYHAPARRKCLHKTRTPPPISDTECYFQDNSTLCCDPALMGGAFGGTDVNCDVAFLYVRAIGLHRLTSHSHPLPIFDTECYFQDNPTLCYDPALMGGAFGGTDVKCDVVGCINQPPGTCNATCAMFTQAVPICKQHASCTCEAMWRDMTCPVVSDLLQLSPSMFD